jgi:hypothetical protein
VLDEDGLQGRPPTILKENNEIIRIGLSDLGGRACRLRNRKITAQSIFIEPNIYRRSFWHFPVPQANDIAIFCCSLPRRISRVSIVYTAEPHLLSSGRVDIDKVEFRFGCIFRRNAQSAAQNA